MMDWCRQNKVAVILLVLGIVFLCTGAAQGGYQDAFRKAVRCAWNASESDKRAAAEDY